MRAVILQECEAGPEQGLRHSGRIVAVCFAKGERTNPLAVGNAVNVLVLEFYAARSPIFLAAASMAKRQRPAPRSSAMARAIPTEVGAAAHTTIRTTVSFDRPDDYTSICHVPRPRGVRHEGHGHGG